MTDATSLPEIHRLSARQLEVIGFTAQGKSDKQVAAILSIRPETVRRHLYQACRVVGLENRMQLVVAWTRWETTKKILNTSA